MRKFVLLFLILTSVALAGCTSQTQASPTSTATAITRSISTSEVTVPTQVARLPDSGCTVVTVKPTPGPTAVTIYPPVSSTDRVKGPDSAKVTIIEYSDFQ